MVADTGCQSCIAGPDIIGTLGLRKSDLMKTKNLMRAVNRSKVELLGLILVKFSGQDGANVVRSTKQVVYVTDSCKGVYLSREACEQLGLISEIFPTIGDCATAEALVGDMEADPVDRPGLAFGPPPGGQQTMDRHGDNTEQRRL